MKEPHPRRQQFGRSSHLEGRIWRVSRVTWSAKEHSKHNHHSVQCSQRVLYVRPTIKRNTESPMWTSHGRKENPTMDLFRIHAQEGTTRLAQCGCIQVPCPELWHGTHGHSSCFCCLLSKTCLMGSGEEAKSRFHAARRTYCCGWRCFCNFSTLFHQQSSDSDFNSQLFFFERGTDFKRTTEHQYKDLCKHITIFCQSFTGNIYIYGQHIYPYIDIYVCMYVCMYVCAHVVTWEEVEEGSEGNHSCHS